MKTPNYILQVEDNAKDAALANSTLKTGGTTCETTRVQPRDDIVAALELGFDLTPSDFTLPRLDELSAKNGPNEISGRPQDSEITPRGTETILVVDDEPAVRHLACAVLEAYGYNVCQASNGEEGVRMVRDSKGPPIRLVLADVMMPVMGGKAMADLLQMTNPEIEILFSSGYSVEAITGYGLLEPGVEFLAKPYTPVMLARKVREMLDNNGAGGCPNRAGSAMGGGEAAPLVSCFRPD